MFVDLLLVLFCIYRSFSHHFYNGTCPLGCLKSVFQVIDALCPLERKQLHQQFGHSVGAPRMMAFTVNSLAAECEPPGQLTAFITVVPRISPGIRYQHGLLVPSIPCCTLEWLVLSSFSPSIWLRVCWFVLNCLLEILSAKEHLLASISLTIPPASNSDFFSVSSAYHNLVLSAKKFCEHLAVKCQR